MHADADVAALVDVRLGRVDPHPHTELNVHWAESMKPVLCFYGGGNRIPGSLEDDEKAVPGGIDLLAGVCRYRLTHDPMVLRANAAEVCAELTRKLSRALDVGEQEGDRAGREVLTHAA